MLSGADKSGFRGQITVYRVILLVRRLAKTAAIFLAVSRSFFRLIEVDPNTVDDIVTVDVGPRDTAAAHIGGRRKRRGGGGRSREGKRGHRFARLQVENFEPAIGFDDDGIWITGRTVRGVEVGIFKVEEKERGKEERVAEEKGR